MLALGLMAGLCQPPVLAAQGEQAAIDTERARAAFKAGVALLKGEDWAGAATHLRDALKLRSSPVIRYNLALALAQDGQVVEALALLDDVLADVGAKPGLLERAQALREETSPRLAHIEVSVSGDADGVRFSLDDSDLPQGSLDGPIAADPGAHVLVAHRDGQELARGTVSLAEGSTGRVALALPRQAVVVPSPKETARRSTPPPGDDRTAGDDDTGLLSSPWFWAGSGAVVVGVIITTVILAGGDDAGGGKQAPTEGTLGSIAVGASSR